MLKDLISLILIKITLPKVMGRVINIKVMIVDY